MPRRNKGREQYEPLDLTPTQVNRDADRERNKQKPRESFHDWQNRRRANEQERAERQRAARINGGIDWSVCLVPGCGKELKLWGGPDPAHRFRAHDFALPLCIDHLVVAFNQAKRASDKDLPLCVAAYTRVLERRQAILDAEADEDKRAFMARTDGHLYAVRQGNLIKIGWSREVSARVRGYGAGVEVLAAWPGTRADETALHRQLRPALVKGREWYEDGPILADLIARVVDQYGEPWVADTWTRPKAIVAGKHHHR